MKRWAAGVAIAVVLLGGGMYLSLDLLVKAGIEHYGSRITGVAVSVREAELAMTEARLTLRGFEIGNPPGYSTPRAMRVATIRVTLDPATLGKDVVLIREIRCEAPEIAYELKGGTNNVETVRRNIAKDLERRGSGAAGGSDDDGNAPGRRYIIERLVLHGARVSTGHPLRKGESLGYGLQDVEFRDVGKASGGFTAEQAAAFVANETLARLAGDIAAHASTPREGAVEGAIDVLRGLFR